MQPVAPNTENARYKVSAVVSVCYEVRVQVKYIAIYMTLLRGLRSVMLKCLGVRFLHLKLTQFLL